MRPGAKATTDVLLKLHRGLLADFTKGTNHDLTLPAQVKGSMNLSKLAMVGHSSSGGYLVNQLGKKHDLSAVVLLHPAADAPTGTHPMPEPTLVVAGQCDEQANPADVAALAPKLAQANGTKPVLHAVTAGATHIAQLSGGDHTVG